jgi:hypothetical protein
MADHNKPGIELHRKILKVAGYAAAAAFCAVSVCANLRYGLSLGKNPMDKATYAIASVAADIFKMAAPLLAEPLGETLPLSERDGPRALARLRELVDGLGRRLCLVEPG